MSDCEEQPVHELVEHLFRHQAGSMLASLCRVFGLENWELAEEVVQDAMVRALKLWAYNGIPEQPAAWLMQVARNRALDVLRRRSAFRQREKVLSELWQARQDASGTPESEVDDDQLAMIFACCHPALSAEARVALTLKTVGGFSVAEIARAFLTPEPTIAQRLVRAKRQLVEAAIELRIPEGEELSARLDSVLQVIYLMFNEGYAPHSGEAWVRQDLCQEAIRLALRLTRQPETAAPKLHAILALMLLQASRLPARVDLQGDLLLLAEQDRSLWDREWISAGMTHLGLASDGDQLTTYHVQAAIAAVHAVSARYEDTNWPQLVNLYDQLWNMEPTPIVALNRAVAISMARGAEEGLQALARLEDERSMANYYLLPSVRADMLARLGRYEEAAANYRQAIQLPCSAPERRFLLRKLEACGVPVAD